MPILRGWWKLREEIIDYLRRERGVKASAEQVIVVTSSQQALSLCTQVLFNPGDRVFVEEPGYQGAKKLVQSAGILAQPIGVDQSGLDIDALIPGRRGRAGRLHHALTSLSVGAFAQHRPEVKAVGLGAT
jgi:GntR family transcriptional regulator / MocR family aminotransferase